MPLYRLGPQYGGCVELGVQREGLTGDVRDDMVLVGAT
jgi:hypothetical protein